MQKKKKKNTILPRFFPFFITWSLYLGKEIWLGTIKTTLKVEKNRKKLFIRIFVLSIIQWICSVMCSVSNLFISSVNKFFINLFVNIYMIKCFFLWIMTSFSKYYLIKDFLFLFNWYCFKYIFFNTKYMMLKFVINLFKSYNFKFTKLSTILWKIIIFFYSF